MTTTATTQDRTLYGCPSWCTFDHAGEILMEPGDHKHELATLGDPFGDSVGLYIAPNDPTHVTVFLGRNGAEEYPATRETVEHLRDLARMLREASDELSGLLQSGELQA
jgi:hypothetical protein